MVMKLRLIEDDLSGEAIKALLQLHLDEMYAWSPPESVHAMPVERLREPDVTFFSAWDGETLAGCGAIKQIDVGHGEIKSMRATPAFRGKGVGRGVLAHLLDVARQRAYARVSLETGSQPQFAPARGLYRAHGFVECEPFASYRPDPASVFMTLAL
jgi:putative acetyltransferase